MENLTKKEYESIQNLYCTDHSLGNSTLVLSVIHYFLSVTAFLGNTLILVASRKESFLHPPSKLLYRSLATTDLLVGLISEPSAALYSVALGLERDRQYWLRVCFYSAAVSTVSFTILCTVSLLTLAAISIDRLLALLSGVRYRHIVTVGRTYSIVIAIVTVNGSSPFLHALWGFSAALVYLNSTLNPVLYCWKIRSFRNAVKDTVKQLCP